MANLGWCVALGALVGLLVVVPAWPAAAVQYHDVTAASGISFQTAGEINGGDPTDLQWPGFAEIFGGGACWGDFDGDGLPDLYIVNHRFNEHNPYVGDWVDALDPRDQLYLNNGDGTFRDATDAAGIPGREFGYSCGVGDVDGDGDLDLFVGNFGRDRLWLNDGQAHFHDATDASGIGAGALCLGKPCVTMSVAWADYDRDGDLDLYVTNYVETNHTDNDRGPERKNGQFNRLYQNDGTGVFTDVAAVAGVQGNPTDDEGSKSFAAVWEDFDADGDLDLYVTNDMVPNDYYENAGDGTFVERSNETGLADPRAGMGLTAGDFDGDCLPDLFFTHYDFQDNGLYRNRGDGTFEDLSGSGAHHNESWSRVGWGTHFVDADLDGDLDILTANGHTEWFAGELGAGYAQQLELFRNDPGPGGTRDWVAIHDESGPSFDVPWVGRGLSLADYDLDGLVDFFVVPNGNETASLHRASAVDDHWLRIELVGNGLNTLGVGARIDVTVDGETQCRRVLAGSGYLGQNDLAVTFGLGASSTVDSLDVHWPSGHVSHFGAVSGDRVLRIFEADDSFIEDTVSPDTRVVGDVPGHGGWWNTPVTVRLETVDRSATVASGVEAREYRFGDAPWAPYGNESFHFDDEGVTIIAARSVDHMGNREPGRALPVGRDFTPPNGTHRIEGTPGTEGWWTSPQVQVALAGTDALSGVGDIRFRIDGGAWLAYERPLVFTGPGGVYDIEYVVVDRAGNEAPAAAFTLRHDPIAPRLDILDPREGTAYVQGRAVPFGLPVPAAILVGVGHPADPDDGGFDVQAVARDDVSGLAVQHLARDGTVVASTNAEALTWRWALDQESSGRHVLTLVATDRAGNAAETERAVYVVAAATPDASTSAAATGGPELATSLLPLVAGVAVVGLVRRKRTP